MNINDKRWDEITVECLKTIEEIEGIDKRILVPGKTQILAILYDIVHLQDEYEEKPVIDTISIDE